MRSGWVQLGAWTAATGAAVALSWLGVHAVLADTVFEGPVALPLPSAASPEPGTAATAPPPAATGAPPTDPGASGGPGGPGSAGATATPRPGPDPDPPANPGGGPSPSRGQASPSRSTAAIRATPSSTTGTVKSYLMPGGRVALDIREHDVQLVSATPEAGWAMQVWHGDQWLRVNFSKDDRVSYLIVTWNGYQPDVQVVPG
ncbi:hypothetical protein [Kitasatospora sp. CB02891]|uniref:hypothetical protein n=1 Tax=Kitasatospora TaxID=2063 RepID=UPI000C272E53|nr:hypothetical protein [Kitasatospora sp. CB02891]PJN22774.1 hypothetical protein CG736_25855 [Kitasatospora sp. CB02891]